MAHINHNNNESRYRKASHHHRQHLLASLPTTISSSSSSSTGGPACTITPVSRQRASTPRSTTTTTHPKRIPGPGRARHLRLHHLRGLPVPVVPRVGRSIRNARRPRRCVGAVRRHSGDVRSRRRPDGMVDGHATATEEVSAKSARSSPRGGGGHGEESTVLPVG